MPGRDATGPMGAGPVTGRGLGLCAGRNILKYGAGLGMGLGLGLACRRGFRGGFGGGGAGRAFPSGTQKDELTQQKNLLERQLKAIEKQMEDM